MDRSKVTRIEIRSSWDGFGSPSSTQLEFINREGSFYRVDAMGESTTPIACSTVDQFLNTVSARPEELDREKLGLSSKKITIDVTDDYPELLVTIHLIEGNPVIIRSESPHAYMLPWIFEMQSLPKLYTYNPSLSRAIADLLPPGCVNRDRLIDPRLSADCLASDDDDD